MAERSSLPAGFPTDGKLHTLTFGDSFSAGSRSAFHTIRYDFKPASVDTTKMSTVDMGENNSLTVQVPHVEGSGTSHTVYKGNKRPAQKECVFIVNPVTGELKLEKISNHLQLKKTRIEGSSRVARPSTPSETSKAPPTSKAQTPPPTKPQTPHRVPVTSSPTSNHYTQSTYPSSHTTHQNYSPQPNNTFNPVADIPSVELMSTSAESSYSSSSGSSSESEEENSRNPKQEPSIDTSRQRLPSFLNDDLQLSESGSDSE